MNNVNFKKRIKNFLRYTYENDLIILPYYKNNILKIAFPCEIKNFFTDEEVKEVEKYLLNVLDTFNRK